MSVKQAIGNEKTSEIAIFARLIKADEGNLTRGLASYLLTLGFDEDDQARMSDLADRNQDGNLASEEQEELLNSTVRQMARNCQVCSVISCPGCST